MHHYFRNWHGRVYTVGLVAIALFTVHALASLIFDIIGLAPSSPQWAAVLILGGFLALAGTAVGLQSLNSSPQRLTGLVSGASSMALLGTYSVRELMGQRASWALVGAGMGLIIGGTLGFWTARRQGFCQVAIALISSLCTYGTAFGLSTWTIAAVTTQHWGLALGLGLATGFYLWLTQRALKWTYHQWQHGLKQPPSAIWF